MSSILTQSQLISEFEQFEGDTVLITGCFDILHVGHFRMISEAAKKGTVGIAVNSDEMIRKLKGNGRPVNCLTDRMEALSYLEDVAWVSWFEDETPVDLITAAIPTYLAKGLDYRDKEFPEVAVCQNQDTELIYTGDHKRRSSTEMIKRVVESYKPTKFLDGGMV